MLKPRPFATDPSSSLHGLDGPERVVQSVCAQYDEVVQTLLAILLRERDIFDCGVVDDARQRDKRPYFHSFHVETPDPLWHHDQLGKHCLCIYLINLSIVRAYGSRTSSVTSRPPTPHREHEAFLRAVKSCHQCALSRLQIP